jgi:hypothetical protein
MAYTPFPYTKMWPPAYGEQAYDLKSYAGTIILYDFLDFFVEAYDFL